MTETPNLTPGGKAQATTDAFRPPELAAYRLRRHLPGSRPELGLAHGIGRCPADPGYRALRRDVRCRALHDGRLEVLR